MESENIWGWKEIMVPPKLIGEEVKKGSGIFEKEYTYVKIPSGCGYDNYCFLLSSNCVHLGVDRDKWWFSINSDMKIELIYDPELREAGKRYKRYKLSGYELYEQIYKEYEINFERESIERLRREQKKRDKRNKANIGRIVCGIYEGNSYCDVQLKYMGEHTLKAYFIGNDQSTYANSKFDKVRNVKVDFTVYENISKYNFLQYEAIINAYLMKYEMFKEIYEKLNNNLNRIEEKQVSRLVRKHTPEYGVVTFTDDLIEKQIKSSKEAMEEVKNRLKERISKLLEKEEDSN